MTSTAMNVRARALWTCVSVLCLIITAGCASPEAGRTGGGDAVASAEPVAIVLVGHGAPPNDFPKEKVGRAMSAVHQLAHADAHAHDGAGGDHGHDGAAHPRGDSDDLALARELVNWPRTPENDPYFYGVHSIADDLEAESGIKVYVGFNEFCVPTTTDAIERAIDDGARQVIVTTVMMTPGGGHSEKDIRNSIHQAQHQSPGVTITYAWPFPTQRLAHVLHLQVNDAIQ